MEKGEGKKCKKKKTRKERKAEILDKTCKLGALYESMTASSGGHLEKSGRMKLKRLEVLGMWRARLTKKK